MTNKKPPRPTGPRKPGRVPRPAGCPASLSSGGQTPRIVPVTKPLVVGLPPKSLSTLFRNRCPVSTGITVQFAPEYAHRRLPRRVAAERSPAQDGINRLVA